MLDRHPYSGNIEVVFEDRVCQIDLNHWAHHMIPVTLIPPGEERFCYARAQIVGERFRRDAIEMVFRGSFVRRDKSPTSENINVKDLMMKRC